MERKLSQHQGDLLRGNTDCLLLFLIKEEGSSYGYQLIKEMQRRSQGYFRFNEGTIYPALHRLESEGLIQGERKELPNGQPRRCYSITAKGEAVLAERIAAWEDFATAVKLVLGPTDT